jgi:hypothetical protein
MTGRRFLGGMLLVVMVACRSHVKNDWDCTMSAEGTACATIAVLDSQKAAGDVTVAERLLSPSSAVFNELRLPEVIGRVVFLPFVDKYGNRHEKSIVYYLEQPSNWHL